MKTNVDYKLMQIQFAKEDVFNKLESSVAAMTFNLTRSLRATFNLQLSADIADRMSEVNSTVADVMALKNEEIQSRIDQQVLEASEEATRALNLTILRLSARINKNAEWIKALKILPKDQIYLGENSYVKYEGKSGTYSEARKHCEKTKSRLPHITNYEMNSGMKKSITFSSSSYFFWLSGRSKPAETTFSHESNGRELEYTSWYSGEPDIAPSGDACIVGQFDTTNWHDVPCTSSRYIMCEYLIQ